MRAYKILSAIIVVAMMLAVPLITVADTSDASVDEKSSAVYFKSKENLSSDAVAAYMTVDMSVESVQNILCATSDFNFGADGFTISDIKTGRYNIEVGSAASISDSTVQEYNFNILSLDIEFKLTANKNGSKLFTGNFNGDASYGFTKSVSVKQNDSMVFKGTLKTECSSCKVQQAISNDGTYVIKDIRDDSAERTELVLDATYTSADGMKQTFKFTNSFTGYSICKSSQTIETKDIKTLALGDLYSADTSKEVTGKGHVSMEYEGRTYNGESKTDSYDTVYSDVQKIDTFSGKQTFTYTDKVLMTADQYKGLYEEVKLKGIFDRFKGTDQELMGQIGEIGTLDVNDLKKVEEKANAEISDIRGEGQSNNTKQIMNAVVAVLIAVVIVLIAAIVLIKRRKNRW